MNKRLNQLIALGMIFIVALVFYFSRSIFVYRYEPEYQENWFYHSQWNIPQSTRGISDGELYKFVGYQLANGENPFNLNFEIPPLAKWLYGLAEKYLGNPYWISALMYLGSALIVFKLAQSKFKNKRIVGLITLLFISTPFVATQVRETMLDLPLMFFYLLHLYWFWQFLDHKTWPSLILAGLFLGLATGVKPPIYTPLVFLLGTVIVGLKSKKIINLFLYGTSVAAGYVGAWTCYFLKHPNPIPWMRLHEKMLSFYLSPSSNVDYLNQWRGIFLNTYQGWWLTGKTVLGDWSLILPIGVVLTLVVLVQALKKRDWPWIYLTGMITIFLAMNTIVPFWSRYLMPIIPLLILVIGKFFKKYWIIILLLALINLPAFFGSLNQNSLGGDAQAVARFISTRAYRELYRSINLKQREQISESGFIKLNQNLVNDLAIRFIEAKVEKINQSKNTATVSMTIEYDTDYGKVVYEPEMIFVNTFGQWRLKWNDDYLLKGYDKDSQIIINKKTIPFLKMIDNKGATMARRNKWHSIYIIPRLMFEWTKHLDLLSEITAQRGLETEKRIQRVIPDDFPAFVGYLDIKLGETGVDKALAIKGVSIKEVEYPLLEERYRQDDNLIKRIRELEEQDPWLFKKEATGFVKNTQGEKFEIPFPTPPQRDVVINY